MHYDYDLADEIYNEEVAKDSEFNKKLVMEWRKDMRDGFAKKMYQIRYGCHIFDEHEYEEGTSYITDNKENKITLWPIEDIKKIASNYITIEDEKFKEYDLYLWANVKKADVYGIESDPVKIIKMAIADLKDKDYPYFQPEERAYKWLEAHREKLSKLS